MNTKYVKRPVSDVNAVEYLIGKGFSQSIAETLSARGINAANYGAFEQNGDMFHDPFEMLNMDRATETITYLMESGGSVLIYGDYDADGLTASSILSLFFSDNGIHNNVIIPTRDEGYGLHAENVFKAFEKDFYDLIITVDCGISNADEVDKIQSELGVEVIVTDHHELPEILPDCICVNPKLGYPFAYLSGAGVAWKLVEALSDRQTAVKYAQLAALGTVADLMPMLDENRSIVRLGLSECNHKSLNKLAELSNCSKQITCFDLSMRISPKINAAGRVGSPQAALQVLLNRDKADLSKINDLLLLNETRKTLAENIMAQSDLLCDSATIRRERMVFIYSDNWQHGLLGIIAARYKEKYKLPAIIMTLDKDVYVGSARGINGIDLFDVFCQCKDLLVKFGGHKASVGFSVAKENLDALRQRLCQVFASFDASCFNNVLYYDFDLGVDCSAADVVKLSETLQPMLPQDKIICRVKDSVKSANSFGKENNHVSITLSSGLVVKGFFKYAEYARIINNGADVDLLCSIDIDSFTNNACGIIEDITLNNSVCFDKFYKINLLQNFVTDNVSASSDADIAASINKDDIAVVFDDYETYLNYAQQYDFSDFFVDIFFDTSLSNKTVVISPVAGYDFERYDNIVCFCNNGMVRRLPERTQYIAVKAARVDLYTLDMSRDICLSAYSALKHKDKFDSITGTYDKYLANKITYEQFTVALRVFEQLGLIKIIDKYNVEFCATGKQDLANSSIFNAFAQEIKHN